MPVGNRGTRQWQLLLTGSSSLHRERQVVRRKAEPCTVSLQIHTMEPGPRKAKSPAVTHGHCMSRTLQSRAASLLGHASLPHTICDLSSLCRHSTWTFNSASSSVVVPSLCPYTGRKPPSDVLGASHRAIGVIVRNKPEVGRLPTRTRQTRAWSPNLIR